MADDTSTTAEVDTETVDDKTPATPTPPAVPVDSESQVKKANREAAALRIRLAEFEDRDKTEAQKLTDRAEAAEKRADALEAQSLRAQVALDHNLPAGLADRLRGTTAEELAEDAVSLLALVPKRPAADVDQGVKGNGERPPAQLTQTDLDRMNPGQIVKAQAAGLLDELLGIKR